jgi:outer membrane lipoprotein-sorting protein
MKRFALIILFLSTATLQAAEPAAIVARADAYRSALDSFVVDVELTSYRGASVQSTSMVRVYGKGADRSLVEFLAPASDKGRRLLMLRDAMWIYMPSASRPIRISPLQRLMGEASNGDIARSNFSVDYDAVAAEEGLLDGRRVWIVELAAKDPATAYSRVRLSVDAASFEPRRAELFAA